MSSRAAISGLGAILCLLITGCSAPQAELTEDDISPIDYNKMQAFNVWLEEQKNLEPSNAFKARPMQVSGKGRVRAVPDIAVITGVITTEADQDDTAIDEAAKIINAVQESVKTQSVELNFTQIQTIEKRDNDCTASNQKALSHHYTIVNDNQYNANIKRRLEQGLDIKIKPRPAKARLDSTVCPVTHIEANLSFTARVKPANEAGNIINNFTTAGVKKVDLLGYDFSDYDTLYKEASTKAVRDAKIKAERVAKIAGTNLTEIVSFRVDSPQRIKRVGQQAMIITNHQNRNALAGGAIDFTDQVVGTGGQSAQFGQLAPPPAPAPVMAYQQPSSSSYSSGNPGKFTVFNGVSTQPIQPRQATVQQADEILTSGQTLAQYRTITNNGVTQRVLVEPTSTTNALKMSLQAGQRTITVNAYLAYLYETPIDGSVVPQKIN